MIEIDDTLLIEFLGGKLDATTSAEVERWYDASDENRRRLERLYLVFFTGERLSAAAAVDPNLSWQTLRRRIEARRRPAPTKRLRTVVRYAAVFAVGLLTAGSLLFPYRSADDRTCTVTTEERACSIRLSDGSNVRLMPHSQLRYASDFGSEGRTVHLTGEAFFDIRKMADAPFTVDAGKETRTVVRGTKFNMKAYDDCSDIETTLIEGVVDFHAGDRTVTLSPGQKISYNPANRKLMLREVNVDAELDAQLRSFQYVQLSKVVESIGTHYGCDIAFGREALGEILFTGTLDYNMPLRHVLEIVTLSTDTRFTRTGDKITIL